MNSKNVREGELKEVFDSLEEAFKEIEIDYYLIGAIARDIWYARGEKKFRATRDVDFAVLVGSQTEYEAVRKYLIGIKGFSGTKTNAFVLITPGGIQVDILPFGAISINGGVKVNGQGLASINVEGFMEVYKAGTADFELVTGHNFKVATLPAIALLKFIAYDDRPEKRLKDARDIANIIYNFYDLFEESIYEQHSDIFTVPDQELADSSLQVLGAVVVGREIKQIAKNNQTLCDRLKLILEGHIAKAEGSSFLQAMVEEISIVDKKVTVEEILKWLTAIHRELSK